LIRHVLFLTPQLPYPPEQGTALRNYHLICQAARFCQVSLLSFAPENAEIPNELGICQRVRLVTAPPQRSLRQRLQTLLFSSNADMAERFASRPFMTALEDMLRDEGYDAVQVEGIELASYALALPPDVRPPIVFDAHNAEWLLQRRSAEADWQSVSRWPAAGYSSIQWRRLQKLERRICLASRVVLACSEMDALALQALEASIHPYVLPNGVDTKRYNQEFAAANIEHPALLFTGKMDYRPNIDAVTWFYHQVWPQIRANVPDIRFYIVGKNPAPSIQTLTREPGIHVTGYVPSVLPYLAAADCYIAPLRVGGGTRLKLLEAMACGLPIVSTTLGAEGLDVVSSKHLLLAHSADAFSQAVLNLLHDREFARQLGINARELARTHYDWDLMMPVLQKAYQDI